MYTPVICQWYIEHISSHNCTDAFTATLAGFAWASTHRSSLSSPMTSYSYLNGGWELAIPVSPISTTTSSSTLPWMVVHRWGFIMPSWTGLASGFHSFSRPIVEVLIFEYPIRSSWCHHLLVIHRGWRSYSLALAALELERSRCASDCQWCWHCIDRQKIFK